MSSPGSFLPFQKKMQAESLPPVAIDNFRYYYEQLLQGKTGYIRESKLQAVDSLPGLTGVTEEDRLAGENARQYAVMIKLNGGLGTSMGLERAKSLIRVKGQLCFLDMIARHARSKSIPLILMNSFATQDDSLQALENYPAAAGQDIPVDFVQHKVPRIRQSDMAPVSYSENPRLEWCPPGHGDIYTAMLTSGTLKALLEAGYQYAFISNADNLGASIDDSILGYMINHGIEFLMEVTDRTMTDRKGGHLARTLDNHLVLREAAQCHPEDSQQFQDITRHKFFNTNNIWINLAALLTALESRNNILELPLICNSKTTDAKNPQSPQVFQLETAMGSAISVFENSAALHVPRSRFAPVKTTNDLLVVRSDAYQVTDDYRLLPAGTGTGLPRVMLDDAYFKLINDFDARIPDETPSLSECTVLQVEGDVCFGKNVQCSGQVHIVNSQDKQFKIPDNASIQGNLPASS